MSPPSVQERPFYNEGHLFKHKQLDSATLCDLIVNELNLVVNELSSHVLWHHTEYFDHTCPQF